MKKFLILVLFPAMVFAQNEPIEMRSNAEGFSVGISVHSLGWSSDYFTVLDDLEPGGIGLGLELGYGFTQRLELIGRVDASSLARNETWDQFTYVNTDLMARFNLGSTTGRFRPYVEVGVGNQSVAVSPVFFDNQEVIYKFSGIGFAYGGGINFFLNRNLLLTLNASGTSGKAQNFTADDSTITDVPDLSNFRIRLGTRFYFK